VQNYLAEAKEMHRKATIKITNAEMLLLLRRPYLMQQYEQSETHFRVISSLTQGG
jgi:hypothetical protein